MGLLNMRLEEMIYEVLFNSEWMNEYILVVQESQREYLVYAFWVPLLNGLLPPPKKHLWLDQFVCVIKLY